MSRVLCKTVLHSVFQKIGIHTSSDNGSRTSTSQFRSFRLSGRVVIIDHEVIVPHELVMFFSKIFPYDKKYVSQKNKISYNQQKLCIFSPCFSRKTGEGEFYGNIKGIRVI
uniref:Uncharacterized protein n=1 Tax=Rhizophagus irregularis (strain DAOM 181602 / DAOM 197198 / MUCL 43194) TaxID=747089 RepID=U9T601_RHIID